MIKRNVLSTFLVVLLLVPLIPPIGIVFSHSGDTLYSSWMKYYPTIDGVISAGEWNDASFYNISYGVNECYLLLKNNENELLIALDAKLDSSFSTSPGWPGSAADRVFIDFDVGHDLSKSSDMELDFNLYGPIEPGQLVNIKAWYVKGGEEVVGEGSASNSTGNMQYELKIPLVRVHLRAGDTAGFAVVIYNAWFAYPLPIDIIYPPGAHPFFGELPYGWEYDPSTFADLILASAPTTYTITFYTDPSDVGFITFGGTRYSNGQSGRYVAGSYAIVANVPSGYVFDSWITVDGVSVENREAASTTATVTGTGAVIAVFKWHVKFRGIVIRHVQYPGGWPAIEVRIEELLLDTANRLRVGEIVEVYRESQFTEIKDGDRVEVYGLGFMLNSGHGVVVKKPEHYVIVLYTVHLESKQNNSASYNKGTIRFDGVDYSSLPTDISKAAGTYSISYTAAVGCEFDHWETSGGVSVADRYKSSTTATVSNNGNLTAIYRAVVVTYGIRLESKQDNGATFNLGTIHFDGVAYSPLPKNITKSSGTYSINYTAASGYEFVRWETSGGINVTNPNLRHISAAVTNNGNLRAIYKKVNSPPIANLSASPTEVFEDIEQVKFDATKSYDPDGSVTKYWFDFGDGRNSGWVTSGIINWTYSDPGTYYAKVKVMDNQGAESGWSSSIRITVKKREGPSITEVKAFYTLDSFFLGNMPDLVKPNQYFVKGTNIVRVEFSVYVDGVRQVYEDRSPNAEGWYNSDFYDMARVTSNLAITAYSSAGDSAQRTVNTNVFDTPFWLSELIYYAKTNKLMNFTADPGYGFDNVWKLYATFKWPQKPINKTVNIPLPIIGGKYGINATFSFTLSLQSNKRVTAEGAGEFEYIVADRDGGVGIYAKATIRITDQIRLEDFFVRISGYVTIPISQDYSWDLGWTMIGVEIGIDVTGAVSFTFHVREASDGGTFCDGFDWVREANDISLTLRPYATIGFGIGEVTVEGEGTVTFTVHVPEPYFTYPDDLSLEARISLILKIKGIGTWRKDVLKYSSGSPVTWTLESSETGWIPRTWATENYSRYLWIENSTVGTYLQNVYLYANPSMASFNDTAMMVWIHDDLSKPYIQGYEVYYSIWDQKKRIWSSPAPITNNSLPESDVVVRFDSKGNAIAVWAVLNNPSLNETVDPFSTLKDIELAYAIWNRTTKTWSQPILITKNNAYDFSPTLISDDLGNLLLIWMTDEDSDISTYGDQSIYAAIWNGMEWLSPKYIANPGLISSPIRAAYHQGKAILVWAQHTDGNATTLNDIEVFYSELLDGTWSSPMKLTQNELEDAYPSVAFWNQYPILVWVERLENKTDALMFFDLYGDNVPKLILQKPGICSPLLMVDSENRILVVWSDEVLPFSPVLGSQDEIMLSELLAESSRRSIYCSLYEYAGGLVDVNYDGQINIIDVAIVAKAFGSFLGDNNWNPEADLDGNKAINIIDIAKVAKEFGKTFSTRIHVRRIAGSRNQTGTYATTYTANSNAETNTVIDPKFPSENHITASMICAVAVSTICIKLKKKHRT